MQPKRSWIKSYEHWFVAVFWVIAAGWTADAVKDTLENLWPAGIYIWRSICVLFFIILTWRLYRLKNRFFDLQLEEVLPDDNPKKRRVLMAFLSDAHGLRHAALDDKNNLVFCGKAIPMENLFDELDEMRKKDPHLYWPWEVIFRMIDHHREVLQKVVLFCSQETVMQAAEFGRIFNAFVSAGDWPEKPHVKICVPRRGTYIVVGTDSPVAADDGFSFNDDFGQMTDAIQAVIQHLETQGFRKADMAIDFTGGTKVTSIVAAGLTFNNPIQAQYVKRKHDKLVVAGYDMIYSNRGADDIA